MKVGIAGLGLIGGSLAKAYEKSEPRYTAMTETGWSRITPSSRAP